MLGRARSVVCLSLLILSAGYAIINGGGDALADSNLSLLLIGLAAVIGSSPLFESDLDSPVTSTDRALSVIALLLPTYVAFQLIPLPLWIVRVISPTRAEIANALAGVMPEQRSAPLSISPPTTWMYFARIAGYVLVFLAIRQIARKSTKSIWLPAVPLIVFGAAEAVWALSQPLAGIAVVTGTYYSKNHLAGLLEMILPFAVMCGTAVLHRGRHRGVVVGSAALTACVLFAVALAMFLAIGFSFSKMGYVSTLGSLLLMGTLALHQTPARWQKRTVVTGMVIATILAFVFITPVGVIEQFGTVVTERTSEGRWPIWKDAARLVAAYPLFGCGLGNFFPGLLRYQTAGVGLAWVNAHNDYLQLISELGVIGALIPAALIGSVFVRAFRVARRGATEDTRFLGLACAGGLTAIMIHSLGDFNTYILSNALVLAWIAGISAALPSSPTSSKQTRVSVIGWEIRPAFRHFVMGLGCAVAVYAAGSIWFFRFAGDNRSTERFLCHVGICNSDFESSDGSTSLADLIELLKRDPAGPYRWDDVGEAMQRAGRTDVARYCFSRSVALGPNSPSTLLMAADFHFDIGENKNALTLLSQRLQVSSGSIDQAVFADLQYRRVPAEEVLRSVTLDRNSSRAYLHYLTDQESSDPREVETVWNWMVLQGFADDGWAQEYVNFLTRKHESAMAWQGWVQYASRAHKGYPKENQVYNGDFEADPTEVPFDWRVDPSVAGLDFDRETKYSGKRSLRITFDGTKNPGEIGVKQEVFLKTGRYKFRAYVKTKDVSTNEGIGFRLRLDDTPSALDLTVGNLRGSNDWTLLEQVFEVTGGGGLARLSVARKPSLKFDNLIGGTVWIDEVSISPDGT